MGLPLYAEAGGGLHHLHDQADAERRERALVERLAGGVVADAEAGVIDHPASIARASSSGRLSAGRCPESITTTSSIPSRSRASARM